MPIVVHGRCPRHSFSSVHALNGILIFFSDTVSRVGVFCSAVNAIEMCKTEGVVDVFQVVKALRIQKPGMVQTVVRKTEGAHYKLAITLF